MVEEPEAERLDIEEEEEGGPVKSFLEHLEDLRWVLIKSLAAAGVAMVACFLAGNYVVDVLLWPVSRAPARHGPKEQIVRVTSGTNVLTTLHLTTNDPLSTLLGTNRFAQLELRPMLLPESTNLVLGLTIVPDAKGGSLSEREKRFVNIVTLGPVDAFVVATKSALYGGLVLASP